MTIGLTVLLMITKMLANNKRDGGVLIVFLPLFNLFAYVMGLFLLAAYALRDRKKQSYLILLLAILIALPQALVYLQSREIPSITFKLGWLAPSQDLISILAFWFQNLGIYLILGAIGYYFASKELRFLFLATTPLFILGNLFIFTPFAWDNIKLFLFFFIVLAILAALALNKIMQRAGAVVAISLVFFMTLTGILSVWTVATSSNITIYDSFDMKACEWAKENTPPNALFLTDGQHTCMFGVVGKRVFLGDLEWITTHGLNYTKQLEENNKMLAGDCELIKKNKIDYIYLGGYGSRRSFVNETFLNEKAVIVFSQNNRIIYKTNC